MSYKNATDTWPSGAQKIVLRNVPNARYTVIFRGSFDGDTAFNHQIPSSCQLIICYCELYETFAVWNAAVHHCIHNPKGMATLSIGEEAKLLLKQGIGWKEIKGTYKPIRQGYKDCTELVILVGKDALYDFCKDYNEYLIPKVEEIPKGKFCLFATPGEQLMKLSEDRMESYQIINRERERLSRAKRDPQFREKVINKWGGKCIICGASERKLLEAAHKESVSKGGSDDPDNGYCLCANHHRLYDAGMLDIKVKENAFSCSSDQAKEMPWYREAESRQFTLFLPSNMIINE